MSQPSTLRASNADTQGSKNDQGTILVPEFRIQVTAPEIIADSDGVVTTPQLLSDNTPVAGTSQPSVSHYLSSGATSISQLNSASWLHCDLSHLAAEVLKIADKNELRNCLFVPDCNKVSNLDEYFLMIEEIGSGATSRVVLAENKQTHEYVALKQLKKEDEFNITVFETEYKILSQLKHSNIAQFYSCYVDNYNYYIATEYCKGGNLVDSIRKFQNFSERQVVRYLNTIIRTVKYLHNKNIIHRDLKPGNLVFDKIATMDADINSNSISISISNTNNNSISKNGIAQLKLIDFGVAIEIDDDDINDDYVGTLIYLPPESVGERTGKILKAGDMWSIGVIAYILVCGTPPFVGHDHSSTLAKVMTENVKWPAKIELTKQCKHFVEKLLQKNPKKRLTAHEALNHEWLKNELDASTVSLSKTFLENLAHFDSTGLLLSTNKKTFDSVLCAK